jgi:hypothetical protein
MSNYSQVSNILHFLLTVCEHAHPYLIFESIERLNDGRYDDDVVIFESMRV